MMNFRWKVKDVSMKANSCFCIYGLFACMLLNASQSVAQGNIAAEQVDIVKAYQPLLADAEKIDFVAEPAATDSSLPVLSYEVKSHLIEVPFTPADIRAVSLPASAPDTLQNNILTAGFGMQLTPLIDLHLHNGNSKNFSYGLHLHHLSSNGSKIDYQDFSNTGGNLFGKAYAGSSVLSAMVGYQHRKNYNYAAAEPDTGGIDKKSMKRTYNLLPVELTFQNTMNGKDKLNYRFGFRYHHFDGLANTSFLVPEKEDYFNFNFLLQKQIQKIHAANVEFSFENLQHKLVGVTDTAQSLLSVIPYYQLQWKNLLLRAGINVTLLSKEVELFPRIHAEYKLIGEYLIPYAGWEGGWYPVTLSELTTVNPYLSNTSPAFTKINKGYFGIKGSYGNFISYAITGSLRSQENLPLYLPDTLNQAYYDVLYYYHADIINVQAEIAYRQSDRISLVLAGETNSYDLDFDDQPWGLPKSKLELTLNYNIQDKIVAKIDLFANSGAYTILPAGSEATQLKGRADASVSFSYDYKKNIACWLAFNNIFGSKNTPWFNYPTYGFQAMAGVKLKF